MNKDEHGFFLALDGRVIEIFGFGHKHSSRRIHIDHLRIFKITKRAKHNI